MKFPIRREVYGRHRCDGRNRTGRASGDTRHTRPRGSRRGDRTYGTDRSRRSDRTHGTDRSRRSDRTHGTDRSRRGGRTYGTDRSRRGGRTYGTDRSRRGDRTHGTDGSRRSVRTHGSHGTDGRRRDDYSCGCGSGRDGYEYCRSVQHSACQFEGGGTACDLAVWGPDLASPNAGLRDILPLTSLVVAHGLQLRSVSVKLSANCGVRVQAVLRSGKWRQTKKGT